MYRRACQSDCASYVLSFLHTTCAHERGPLSEKPKCPEDERLFSEIEDKIKAVTEVAQATLLIQKHKELEDISETLANVRAECELSMETCQKRQTLFERKRKDIKNRVDDTHDQIKESSKKCKRAESKERGEIKHQKQLDSVISKKLEELSRLGDEKIRLKDCVKRLLKHQEYLEDVVESSPEMYEEVSEVLNRHSMLVDTKGDLESSIAESNVKLRRLRSELQQLRSEGHKSILVQQALVHRYQKRVEELNMHTAKASMEIERDVKIHDQKSREFAQVFMATRNLYNRCLATTRSKRSSGGGGLKSPSGATGGATTMALAGNGAVGTKKKKKKSTGGASSSRTSQNVFDASMPVRKQMEVALRYISSRVIILSDIKKGYAAWERGRSSGAVEGGTHGSITT